MDANRYGCNRDEAKLIPFSFEIKLPPPLKRGVDYGFRPRTASTNIKLTAKP